MDSAQWLANYDKRLAQAATSAEVVSASLRQAGGWATSPHGEVAVTVGAGGALEDLRLTPAARRLESEQLAQLILATARQAQRMAGAQVTEIMTEYLGESPALDLVTQNMPTAAGVDVQSRAGSPLIDNRRDDDYFANPPEINQ